MYRCLLTVCLLTPACAGKTARWTVPAEPAAVVPSAAVAVVARTPACTGTAKALIAQLGATGSWTVTPRADTQLSLVECRNGESPQETDAGPAAYAVVLVDAPGTNQAQLLGTADGAAERWRSGRTARAVALDLAGQLDPQPVVLVRRVYPRALPGSVRHQLTLAVEAERQGDLARAWELAQSAADRQPSHRTTRYLEDLAGRLHIGCAPCPP